MRNLAKLEITEVSGGDEQMGPPAPPPSPPPCTTTTTVTQPTVSIGLTISPTAPSVTVTWTSGGGSTGTTCPVGSFPNPGDLGPGKALPPEDSDPWKSTWG